jgi:hypothetical protein
MTMSELMCQDIEVTVPPDMMVEEAAMVGTFVTLIPAKVRNCRPPLIHL